MNIPSTSRTGKDLVRTGAQYPGVKDSKFYTKGLHKVQRSSVCQGSNCLPTSRCAACVQWEALPDKWAQQPAKPTAIFKPRAPTSAVLVPMAVARVNASAALSSANLTLFQEAQSRALMADVLAEHFAVDSTAANQESVQLVMSQQLVMEALTTFADPCDQYHKKLCRIFIV